MNLNEVSKNALENAKDVKLMELKLTITPFQC